MAGWEYWFQGQSYGNSAKDFVNTVFDNYPLLKEQYKDAPEFKRNNVENKILWFTFAHKLKRHHLEGQLGVDLDLDIIPIDDAGENDTEDDVPPEGDERWAFRKERVHQAAFRKKILDAYGGKCCVTDIDIKELLIASHIMPYKVADERKKKDPRNGLCLNALHDRAFDRGLIAIADDFTVVVSKKLASYKNKENKAMRNMLLDYEGEKIKLPANRSKPLIELLKWHRENVYEG